MLRAERIREAVLRKELAERFTLLVGEARVAAVRGRIGEVDLGVRDIEVAADHDRLLLGEAGEVFAEIGVPLQPVVEALQLALGIRDVGADDEEPFEFGRHHAPFGRMVSREISGDGKRRGLREHRGARVALLLRFVPELMRIGQAERGSDGGLTLRLLQAEHIRVSGRDEIGKPLAEGGANAVDVPGIDLRVTHGRIT